MTTTPEHDERVAKLTFAGVYPHYVTKVKKREEQRKSCTKLLHG